jgi:hypothetical protein
VTHAREEPQRARGGIAPMRLAVERYLRDSGLGARMRGLEVFRAWKQAVGVALAARARPVRFENGELEVAVRSAAHLNELESFTGESFRRKANQRLGSERIRRVVFRLET